MTEAVAALVTAVAASIFGAVAMVRQIKADRRRTARTDIDSIVNGFNRLVTNLQDQLDRAELREKHLKAEVDQLKARNLVQKAEGL